MTSLVNPRIWHLQVFFAATGVSDGDLLRGVRYFSGGASTNSIVMRASSGTGVCFLRPFSRRVVTSASQSFHNHRKLAALAPGMPDSTPDLHVVIFAPLNSSIPFMFPHPPRGWQEAGTGMYQL